MSNNTNGLLLADDQLEQVDGGVAALIATIVFGLFMAGVEVGKALANHTK